MSETAAGPAPQLLVDADLPPELREVISMLQASSHEAFLVGGSVRDILLGKQAKDFDVATSARPDAVCRLFRRVVPTGIRHGTVTVLVRGKAVEVTTFRGEGAYQDGRRPDEVVFLDAIEDDLSRRDFTINAMAFDPEARRFVDPFGGVRDLAGGLVRCVGEPMRRFGEDGLRPLRAVRFASVLGFRIDPPTFAAIGENLETFAKVARERVREEFVKLVVGPRPAEGLRLLERSELLPLVLSDLASLVGRPGPAGRDLFSFALARAQACAPSLELRLAALLADVAMASGGNADRARAMAEAAVESLRFPRKSIESVGRLVGDAGFGFATYPDDAAVRRAISTVGRELVSPLLDLAHAQAVALPDGHLEAFVARLRSRIGAILAQNPPLSTSDLALDGREVIALLGEGPGPRVGDALRFLLSRVLDDPSLNSPDALVSLLRARRNR